MRYLDSSSLASLAGKKVLVRVDFNVPLQETPGQAAPAQNIRDDTRIRAALPTIRLLLEHRCALILISHLGRPKGPDQTFSLRPCADRLQKLLGRPVLFCDACTGEVVEGMVRELQAGEVLMLENLRFEAGEEKNDPDLARRLARLADAFVQDGFGAVHRAHASTAGVPAHLPSFAGLLLQKEIEVLSRLRDDPPHPFVAAIGGRKISDKIGVLERLAENCDMILIGGALAYTFLKAEGRAIGASAVEPEEVETAKRIRQKAPYRFWTPLDHLCRDADGKTIATAGPDIPDGAAGLDIGPKTRLLYRDKIRGSRLALIAGPMGRFEEAGFEAGTKEVLFAAAEISRGIGLGVAAGGETAEAAVKFQVSGQLSHVSTGGGAALEFLEGKVLPGLAALEKAPAEARA